MDAKDPRAASILAFWFGNGDRDKRWFEKNRAFDDEVRQRFLALHGESAAGSLAHWKNDAADCLALIVLLDQFPRNMFRGEARTYSTDAAARDVADRALARGFDQQVARPERQFFYLPFMHSEDHADQERCVMLARGYGDDQFTRYAEDHADIVRRFGRFPHRNAALRRATSAEEQAFLDGGGFAG